MENQIPKRTVKAFKNRLLRDISNGVCYDYLLTNVIKLNEFIPDEMVEIIFNHLDEPSR